MLSLLIGRQIINEVLWPAIPKPGQRWQSVQRMVEARKLLLFSAETMLRGDDRQTFGELRQLLVSSAISPEDSWVVAHSSIFRMLLFTKERRQKEAVRASLANPRVTKYLTQHGLAHAYPDIIAE